MDRNQSCSTSEKPKEQRFSCAQWAGSGETIAAFCSTVMSPSTTTSKTHDGAFPSVLARKESSRRTNSTPNNSPLSRPCQSCRAGRAIRSRWCTVIKQPSRWILPNVLNVEQPRTPWVATSVSPPRYDSRGRATGLYKRNSGRLPSPEASIHVMPEGDRPRRSPMECSDSSGARKRRCGRPGHVFSS